ncbi:MAG: hypothetical protein AMK73_06515 [Planctomycetes bacterium SM23_32]|nr:MAG: hypothetical protein AMK73_06515 [Planctomycetes bacterium SM23_32]
MANEEDNRRAAAPEVDEKLLSLLVCPACRQPVEPRGGLLRCTGCGLGYPVEDGVPVMLVEQAVPPETDPSAPSEDERP